MWDLKTTKGNPVIEGCPQRVFLNLSQDVNPDIAEKGCFFIGLFLYRLNYDDMDYSPVFLQSEIDGQLSEVSWRIKIAF